MSKIKVMDKYGNPLEIELSLWNNLVKMKDCQYRVADVKPPQEVIEFKTASEIESFIETTKCCEGKCEIKNPVEETNEVVEEPKKQPVKRTTKKGGKRGK